MKRTCLDRVRCFTDYQVFLVIFEHAQTVSTRPSPQQGEWPGGEAREQQAQAETANQLYYLQVLLKAIL